MLTTFRVGIWHIPYKAEQVKTTIAQNNFASYITI